MVANDAPTPALRSKIMWTPLRVGNLNLKHRVIMSPLTRARSPSGIPTKLAVEYYAQRATEGGLIISEGVHPSFMGGNLFNIPSMYSPEHIRAWKPITNAVHAKGAYMFMQIWHTGRVSVSINLGGRKPLSASTLKIENSTQPFTPVGRIPKEEPQEMTLQDVEDTIADYVHSAKCAIEAGFDGIEILAGNGYLPEQFMNPIVNHSREDKYGGSLENRARLTLDIVNGISSAIGASRVGIRLSPFNYHEMPEPHPDPIPAYTYLLSHIEALGIAYVSLMQPRSDMFIPASERLEAVRAAARARGVSEDKLDDETSLEPFRRTLAKTPLLSSGAFDAENWVKPIEDGELDGIVFGRWFISNPDLVKRLRNGWPLQEYNRSTFYGGGEKGYTDYPVWDGVAAAAS